MKFLTGQHGIILAKKKRKKSIRSKYKFYQTMVIRKAGYVPVTKLPTHLMVKAKNSKEAAEAILESYREHVEGKTKSIKTIKIYLTSRPNKAGVFFPVHPPIRIFNVLNGRLIG